MKSSASLIVAVVALAMAATALVLTLGRAPQDEGSAEPYEVAVAMGRLQRFAEKLYFSGTAENWPLADFYLHEIEETSDEVIRAGAMDEGVAVSAYMRTMFPPALAEMKKALQTRQVEPFNRAYEGLLLSCNACHQSTGHGYVRLKAPAAPSYPSQEFRPQGGRP